jgi:formate-dependent nitrite reductase membrane component NrfD
VSDAGRRAHVPEGPLSRLPPPPEPAPHEEPPADARSRASQWVAGHDTTTRDTTPALGARGGPASWRRAVEGARVALAHRGWGDARWSYLFKDDTGYAAARPARGQVAQANRRMRSAPIPATVQGPFIKPPVWTWEVPLYFWIGGMAAGSSFIALAADVAGDARSARIARRVAVGAVAPAPLLLIADLGRPARFLNMLRIFKPRSPMNTGAWSLVAFSAVEGAAVAADLAGRDRAGRRLGAAGAAIGGYLGSYTGVLLATTAVPLWARSRLLLGPIFVATAAATGASACRLTLRASGLPDGHPTRTALGVIEAGAMGTELALSIVNHRRLGSVSAALSVGAGKRWFTAAKWLVRGGLTLQALRVRAGPRVHDVASVGFLAAGLCFRVAWVQAGKTSARDDEVVARAARGRLGGGEDEHALRPPRRMVTRDRRPLRTGPAAALRRWSAAIGAASLRVERAVKRG